MEETFKIVFSGKLMDGFDPEQVVRAFSQLFKVPESQAQQVLGTSHPIALKKNLDRPTAEKLRVAMAKLGMQVHLEAGDPAQHSLGSLPGQGGADRPATTSPLAASGPRCPKCGSDRVQGDDCLACGIIISRYRERQARLTAEAEQNPYATPQSDLTPVHTGEEGEMTGPHTVPAAHGWQWITGGWGHFKQNPLPWIGAIVVWFILIIIASLIPLLGPLAVNLLMPVIIAGFLIGAEAQREGESFEFRHLFAGFSTNPGRLILVGLLYLVGTFVVMLVVGVVVGGSLFATMGQMQGGQASPEMAAAMLGPMVFASLLAMALMVPLIMAYWFAPALVAFEDLGAFEAIVLSFKACLKNVLPFLVYGIVTFGLVILAALPLGLGFLVLSPVMIAAMYVSYRDIFYTPA